MMRGSLGGLQSLYPFTPKSTRDLVAGQFWAVPLSDGRFASGRILQLHASTIPTPTRSFFGGLHDWIGVLPPTAATIARSAFLDYGIMHIKAITEIGRQILGVCPLASDEAELPTLLSAMGGPGTMLLRGAAPARPAQTAEWGRFPVLSYWGYDFIQQLAEHRLLGSP